MTLPAGVYRHHKGGLYQLLGVGEHTENGEILVAYITLTGADLPGPRLRFRPLHGDKGWLTPEALPSGESVERFVYIGIEITSKEKSP